MSSPGRVHLSGNAAAVCVLHPLGLWPGLLVCTAFGLLQVFVQGAVSYGWISILLDYIVAFMPLCLCGLGKGKPGGLFWGSVLGSVGRFVIHFISGITVYRILEPTGLMGMTFSNPYTLLRKA